MTDIKADVRRGISHMMDKDRNRSEIPTDAEVVIAGFLRIGGGSDLLTIPGQNRELNRDVIGAGLMIDSKPDSGRLKVVLNFSTDPNTPLVETKDIDKEVQVTIRNVFLGKLQSLTDSADMIPDDISDKEKTVLSRELLKAYSLLNPQ